MFNVKKRVKFLLIFAIGLTLIMGLGSTYAFFVYRESGSNVSLVGGEVKVTFVNDNNYLTTGNSYPISDNTGKVLPYYSDFSINTVTDKVDIKYEIQLIPDEGNTIDSKYIKVYLTDQNDNPVTNVLYYNELHEAEYNDNAKAVYTSYMTETGTKDFRLRMWIDESYNIKDGETFGFTINLYAVNGKANFLSDKIEDTLQLTEPDIDGTRYVYGQTEDNYLWYSGKLWRIVSINDDGTIKLVTQGNMTAIAWDTSSTNTDYSTSQVRRWLNNEFLPTLYDADNLLLDSTWDYTTYAETPVTKITPTSVVENEKVGLLTIYDYFRLGTGSSSFLNNGYYWWTMSPQTDGSNVWYVNDYGDAYGDIPDDTLGVRPSVNLKSDIQIMGGAGTKLNPYVIGGDKDTGVTSELLSNRISGEYINFNDVLYRIVGTEEIDGQKLTKIRMADYSVNSNTLNSSLAYGADYSQRVFSPTYGIGLYLEEWYQADSTSEIYSTTYIKDNYKAMIATSGENGDNVVWYTGPTSGTDRDYTLSKTGSPVSATIGLGYYGEMFSSQFGDGYNSSTTAWLMTIRSSSYVWGDSSYGTAYKIIPTDANGARPSLYLKSDVKITGGSGMPDDPYEIEYEPKKLSDEVEEKLTLTSADSDCNRYVTGSDPDNYLWYSGKLWRIVSINCDGSVKLVTQGNMTTLAWDTSSTNTDYSTSQVRKWLNNEFLPTLYDANNLLVDSTWDYTTYAEATTTKVEPVNVVENEKVGLLTIYDYYKVRNGSDSSFLTNGYLWWTMSPQSNSSYVWSNGGDGGIGAFSPTYFYSIRPSINMKSNIQIMNGDGTKTNPYVIGGDKNTGFNSELLNNRISGEYINFNDVLYRIVGTEEINGQKLTKITMADYSVNSNTLIDSLAYGASDSDINYNTSTGIGKYLNDWYNGTSINSTYKSMIATAGETGDGVVWYTGPTSGVVCDYTLAKTGLEVSATIGLGYYGEMFSSQLGVGYDTSLNTWLMTKYSGTGILVVSNYGGMSSGTANDKYGVKPSMYLKSDVKIVSGSGMPHNPYILTQ